MGERLAHEDSVYLRDHASDPIDWWPWGPGALREAQRRRRPLFVSIGYAACHWCHVMAQTTFHDPEVAALINEHFVPVKVDREEHPALDARFMAALLALQGSGGWPITAIATAEGRPAWATTYLPPRRSQLGPGLLETLRSILEALEADPTVLERAAAELSALQGRRRRPPTPLVSPQAPQLRSLGDRLLADLRGQLDERFGGFGREPKFPQAHALLSLAELAHAVGDAASFEAVTSTARRFVRSALFDQVGGGFFRYATDRALTEVHYEKMLVDQAWLIALLAQLAHDTSDPELRLATARTVAFVRRELVRPDGLLATSLDADRDGVEGGAYRLTAADLREALPAGVADELAEALGLHDGEARVPRVVPDRALITDDRLLSALDTLWRWLRQHRPPRRDDKALCDANAATATALLRAGRLLEERSWIAWGLGLAERVRARFLQPDGVRHVSYVGGSARLAASTDELWFSIMALAVWEVTGLATWLSLSLESLERLLERSLLDPLGICLGSAHEPDPIPDRLDGAHPSATALAVWHVSRLASVQPDSELATTLAQLVGDLDDVIAEAPSAASLAVTALALRDAHRTIVVPTRTDTALVWSALTHARPLDVVVRDPLHPLAHGRDPATASICVGWQCLLPLDDPAALAVALRDPVLPRTFEPPAAPD